MMSNLLVAHGVGGRNATSGKLRYEPQRRRTAPIPLLLDNDSNSDRRLIHTTTCIEGNVLPDNTPINANKNTHLDTANANRAASANQPRLCETVSHGNGLEQSGSNFSAAPKVPASPEPKKIAGKSSKSLETSIPKASPLGTPMSVLPPLPPVPTTKSKITPGNSSEGKEKVPAEEHIQSNTRSLLVTRSVVKRSANGDPPSLTGEASGPNHTLDQVVPPERTLSENPLAKRTMTNNTSIIRPNGAAFSAFRIQFPREEDEVEKSPQEWLQNSIIFYLSANLLELHELQQRRKKLENFETQPGAKRIDNLSLMSSWTMEDETVLYNVQSSVSFAVLEVDSLLLHRFFTRWSNQNLRQLVKNVTTSWKNHGPDSEKFQVASMHMLEAVSQDEIGKISFTPLYRLRQYLGSHNHTVIPFIFFTVSVVVCIVCIIFIAVFGREVVAVSATLSAVLGVLILLCYFLSLLILHHNSFADAAETFLRREALTVTKENIRDDYSNSTFIETTSWTDNSSQNDIIRNNMTNKNDPKRPDGIEGEDHFVSMISKSLQPTNPVKQYQLEQDRENTLLLSDLVYQQHQLNMKLRQQEIVRRMEKDSREGSYSPETGSIVDGIKDNITITALVYCKNDQAMDKVAKTLWERKFLVLRADMKSLDSAYYHGSERFKIILLHAPDVTGLQFEQALIWLRGKRPVFFFSADVGDFRTEVPLSARMELPLSEQDANTLLLSGIGIDEQEQTSTDAQQPFRVPPYRLGRRLGAGAFGNVFEAEIIETRAKCAVKRIYLKEADDDRDGASNGPSSQLREIAQEVEIMSSLSHPNIVQYMFCERDDNCISIFMELCKGGSLSNMINKRELRDPEEVKRILSDIVNAVAYLHKRRIVHRDLKPDNVLFRDGHAKLTDFGTAVHKKREDLNLVKGTLAYMAPEILVGEPYGKACDVWSIGCIAADVLYIDLPQRSLSLAEMCDFYRKMGSDAPLEFECDVPQVKSFLLSCLQRNPKERLTASQLLNHEILQPQSTALNKWLIAIDAKWKAMDAEIGRQNSDLNSESLNSNSL